MSKRIFGFAASIVAVAWTLFQIVVALYPEISPVITLGFHLMLMLSLSTFVLVRQWSQKREKVGMFPGIGLFIVGLLPLGLLPYFLVNLLRIESRIPVVDPVFPVDIIAGVIVILYILELTRRNFGWPLFAVAAFLVVYSFVAYLLPGLFRSREIVLSKFIDYQFLSFEGIFGTPLYISCTVIFYFILFAAFMEMTGTGKILIQLALKCVGKRKSGAAESAVIASTLFGMVSGSSTANAVSVGCVTIPFMKNVGYKPIFAGAVEAAASTGGQIMPPVMGAAAFIIAQMLGVPYYYIAVVAIIPALLYYFAIFIAIDLETSRTQIISMEAPDLGPMKKTIYMIIPLLVLFYFIFTGGTLAGSAIKSSVLVLALGLIRAETRRQYKTFFRQLALSGERMIDVALSCASAGIIIGVLTLTGVSLTFTNAILEMTGGNLILVAFLAAIATIILGMGMPTTAAYIMSAVFFAPALIQAGVMPLAAHFFVFFFACISMITPPVAITSYAAASMAGSPPGITSYKSFWLVLPAFFVPFVMLSYPEILLQGEVTLIVWRVFLTAIAVAAMAFSFSGWWKGPVHPLVRLALFALAISTLLPSMICNIVGILIIGAIFIYHYRRSPSPSPLVPGQLSEEAR